MVRTGDEQAADWVGGRYSAYGRTWHLSGQPEEKHDEFVNVAGLWTEIGNREQKRVCVCVFFLHCVSLILQFRKKKTCCISLQTSCQQFYTFALQAARPQSPISPPIQLVVRAGLLVYSRSVSVLFFLRLFITTRFTNYNIPRLLSTCYMPRPAHSL